MNSGRLQAPSPMSAKMSSSGDLTAADMLASDKSLLLYLAITTVVQELLSLGRSRVAAMLTGRLRRSPRTIGQ